MNKLVVQFVSVCLVKEDLERICQLEEDDLSPFNVPLIINFSLDLKRKQKKMLIECIVSHTN